MAKHAEKKEYEVIGETSTPANLSVKENVRAYSEAQAVWLVERRICEKTKRRKIYWRDVEAICLTTESAESPVPAARPRRENPTRQFRHSFQLNFGFGR